MAHPQLPWALGDPVWQVCRAGGEPTDQWPAVRCTHSRNAAIDSGSRWGPRTSGLGGETRSPPTPQCPNPSLPPYRLCWCSRPACPQPSWRWREAAWGRLSGPCEAQPALRCPRFPRCCLLRRSSPHPRPLWRRPPAPWTVGTAPGKGRMPRYPSFPSLGAQAVCVVCFRCPG